jgi:hypothetical protein
VLITTDNAHFGTTTSQRNYSCGPVVHVEAFGELLKLQVTPCGRLAALHKAGGGGGARVSAQRARARARPLVKLAQKAPAAGRSLSAAATTRRRQQLSRPGPAGLPPLASS